MVCRFRLLLAFLKIAIGQGTTDKGKATASGQKYSNPNDWGNITYPTDPKYPDDILYEGKNYRYAEDGTEPGTYTVRWTRMVDSDGANNPDGSSITTNASWHLDAIVVLHDEELVVVNFQIKGPGENRFSQAYLSEDVPALYSDVVEGSMLASNRIPSYGDTNVNGLTWSFSGWYTDEDCKIPANFTTPINNDTVFYGKYVENVVTVTYDLNGGNIDGDTNDVVYENQQVGAYTPKLGSVPVREGYKFQGWTWSEQEKPTIDLPEMVAGTVTYTAQWEPDEDQTKELSYTVEYYKDGEKVKADTQTEKQIVQVLQPDTLTVDKTKINTTDKYYGYKFEKSEPAPIPDTVGNNGVIKVYYVTRTDLTYTVNYYLEGTTTEVAESNTVENQTYGASVTENAIAVPNYVVEGMRTQTITIGVEDNVINFYYTTDQIGPNGGSDGTPDKYQATVTFTVVNGTWTGGGTTRSTVVTLRNAAGEMAADGTYTLRTGDIPTGTANAGYANGVWGANANPNGAVIDRRGASYELTYAPAGTTGPVFPPPDPGPGTGGGTITIPENPTPLGPDPDGATTILDEEVPLANAVGLNITEHFAYIIGYEDDTVRPLKNITRAEAVTIFFRLMEDDYRAANWSMENPFSDVNAGNWHNNAVSTCLKAGALKHFAQDAAFLPNQAITRAEFASIAAGFVSDEITGESIGDFSDTEGHWAAADIRKAVEAGWIKGVGGNRFAPDETITRAEVMTIVNRMLDRVPDAEHMLPDMKKWLDNPEDAWYYEAVQEATNEHDYDVDEFGAESWTEILEARDWKSLENEWANNGGMSASAEPVKPEEGAEGEGEAEDAGSESEEA